MNKTFLTLSLILAFQAHAQNDNSCSDIAAFTCNAVVASDGTSVGSVKASKSEFTETLKTETFPAVQKAFIKKISSLPLEETARTTILAKISKMKFSTECEQLSNRLDESLWPNSFYTHSDNVFYLCKAKPGMSEFVVAKMIASELSEMINPCGINNIIPRPREKNESLEQSEKEYPIKGLISCLRSENTAGAKRDGSKAFKETKFCTDDQVTRSVSDWLTTEVVTDYISQKYDSHENNKENLTASQWRQGIANSYNSECSFDRPDDGFSEDLSFQRRMNSIVGTNPTLRNKLGCYNKAAYAYCDGSNPDAMAKVIGQPKAAGSGGGTTTPANSQGGVK
ncbi:hypothetical protein B9G69_017210 [Bdellovibrio sp. SKB1291214]|uniref:hypothetical protein n=1 Tax=Bdellovibrio sp. SKB1291214 TaxID=1732569 RepID=UPI000B51B77D|nr:hypothetical protein [Bdellovibrio sp. SKB1291214]UYL08784.1 hypothetical protein B9G69_017210 [Bdellovibrio sp. SKB1291214]